LKQVSTFIHLILTVFLAAERQPKNMALYDHSFFVVISCFQD
jgi:hypothetical protein